MQSVPFGNTGLMTPPLVFGSTALGNLFREFSYESKLATMRAIIEHLPKPVVIDSAGKYGAGLALEVMGDCLRELGVDDDEVIISNKLAWLRAPLTTPEPTFEPGAWFGLEHDAVQDISYDGIRKCFEQGLELLGGDYSTQLVSVHDPDEYLDAASSPADRERRFDDILGAYTALGELKAAGAAKGIGVGAKNWKSIAEIDAQVELDWVMFANSYTLYSHPADLLAFMDSLRDKGVAIINSAVFNAGFLTGGEFFNYVKLDAGESRTSGEIRLAREVFPRSARGMDKSRPKCASNSANRIRASSRWRSAPADRSASKPMSMLCLSTVPAAFWDVLKEEGLLAEDHPYIN